MTMQRSQESAMPEGDIETRAISISAPRTTRVTALIVMIGVLAQAALAGGFLAGNGGLTTVHMIVGMALVVSAIVLVIVGLFPRRDHRRWLTIRLAVLILLVLTGVAGALAGQGTRDLLIVHIPLAIVSMGMASRLFDAARR
jgi:hypothetical protein